MFDLKKIAQHHAKNSEPPVRDVRDVRDNNPHIYARALASKDTQIYIGRKNPHNPNNPYTPDGDNKPETAPTNPEPGFADEMEAIIPGYIEWAFGGRLPESQRRLLEAENHLN